MKAKIKTEVLKNVMAKAVNGAGNNKLIPITSLMELKIVQSDLLVTTTDMVHFLYVNDTLAEVAQDELCAVIEVEKFAKLISKITTEYVTVEDCGKYIEIVGNGKYTIDIPLDENGERIKYPEPNSQIEEEFKTKKTILDLISSVCKASVAKTLEVPVYTNYYVGNTVLATDTYAISSVDINLFGEKKILIPYELMELLSVIDTEEVKVRFADNNRVWFETDNVGILGKLADGVDEYAVDAIEGLVKQEFDSVCKFKTSDMLSALERIALFVGPYDDSAVKLTFTEKGISVESKQSNGIEVVEYTESENYVPFTCMININMLIAELKANGADEITMQYGAENSVKLVEGVVTQVIALLEQ